MKLTALFSLGLLVLLPVQPAFGLPPMQSAPRVQPVTAQVLDASRYVDANDLLGFVTNFGHLFYDAGKMFGQNEGLYYPYRGTEYIQNGLYRNTVIYSAGMWLGGKVGGQPYVAVVDYNSEYVPGRMVNGAPDWPEDPAYRVYKVYADSMAGNPNADYLEWPVDQGAPVDSLGRPLLLGEQTLFSVFNEASQSNHWNNAGSTPPLGIEIRQTVWADQGLTVTDTGTIPLRYTATPSHPSAESLSVWAIDGKQITGHDYRVEVHPDSMIGQYWNLIDASTANPVLDHQTALSRVLADGMRLQVFAPQVGVGAGDPGSPNAGWDVPGGTQRFSWENGNGWGMEGFHGALGWTSPYAHYNNLPDTVPASHLTDVLLVLAATDNLGNPVAGDTNVSYAYRYVRLAQNPPAQPEFAPYLVNPSSSYAFQDFVSCLPLSAWDVSSTPPRRLAVGFLENNSYSGRVNGKYWPPYATEPETNNMFDQREWLFIFDADYSTTSNPDFETSVYYHNLPIMYTATWCRLDNVGWSAGDQFIIHPYKGPEQVDSFAFTATMPATYVYQRGTGTVIHARYDLFNKGSNEISNMYVGLWADPDIGSSGDDLVGCDTVDRAFYCYNDGPDDEYGFAPPAVGLKIEQGPIVPSAGNAATFFGQTVTGFRNLPASAFVKYINGTDPYSYLQTYNYLQGLNSDGTEYIAPTGKKTRFWCSGNPVTGVGDIDYNPADRRMMTSIGPFNFNPGDSQQVIVAWGVAQGSSALNSITQLKRVVFDLPSCCVGTTGNVDGLAQIDLSDLSLLIDYLVNPARPHLPCRDAANVNTRGIVDLGDLSLLVAYLTLTPTPSLPGCP